VREQQICPLLRKRRSYAVLFEGLGPRRLGFRSNDNCLSDVVGLNFLLLEGKRWHCVDREVSLEERGTETNSFNGVLGAWFGARVFPQAFVTATEFAGCSNAQAHCLALESWLLDGS
jgi:hypothetical protein